MLDDTLRAIKETEAEAAGIVASAAEEGARLIEEAKAEAAEIMKRQTDEASSRAESDLRAAG